MGKDDKERHPVVWFEVTGSDSKSLGSFYSKLFGWKIDDDNPMRYGIVDTGTKDGIPGGVGPTQNGGRPAVTFYVRTRDLQKSLDEAERLGGKTVVHPTELPDVSLALFADPQGNVVGLLKE